MLSAIAPVVLETLKLSTIDSDVSKYFRNVVQETVEYREKNNVKRNDFLQLLIKLKNKGLLDDELEIEDQNNETNKNTKNNEGTYTPNSVMCINCTYFAGEFTCTTI
jgi:cytochrome P450 family 6